MKQNSCSLISRMMQSGRYNLPCVAFLTFFLVGLCFPMSSGYAGVWSKAPSFSPPPSSLIKIQDTSQRAEDQLLKGGKNFIENVTARGLNFLADETLTFQERKAEFRKLFKDSFDIKTIGRFSMGRYWRKATAEQREEFLKLFQKMIIQIYSNRFDEYSGQKLEIISARPAGEKDVIVKSKIISPNSSDISVRWRVRYDENKYQIIDVVIEGVSMLVTQRSDFASVIQRGVGKVSVLLDHMRSKIQEADQQDNKPQSKDTSGGESQSNTELRKKDEKAGSVVPQNSGNPADQSQKAEIGEHKE